MIKGDGRDCNNYMGISLLSSVDKLYACVVFVHLQQLAERVYPESHCGFRAERSTVDMIFRLRQLQEKCREQQKPLYIAFIDLTKVFNLVSRNGLFNILLKIGCPLKLYSIIKFFYDDMKTSMRAVYLSHLTSSAVEEAKSRDYTAVANRRESPPPIVRAGSTEELPRETRRPEEAVTSDVTGETYGSGDQTAADGRGRFVGARTVASPGTECRYFLM
ncbi:hypothetical protein ACOMHN_013524 [Nucella lapillus]